MSGSRRRHDLGRTWSRPTSGCPSTIKAQIARAARPPQHRGDLRRRDADRKAPRAEGAVPGRRASGGAHASGNRREDPVRQQRSRRISPTFTRRRTCASARTTARAPANLLNYLLSQAGDPRVPGPLPLAHQQRGDLGQPLRRSTTRSRTTGRRCAIWSAPESSATDLTNALIRNSGGAGSEIGPLPQDRGQGGHDMTTATTAAPAVAHPARADRSR